MALRRTKIRFAFVKQGNLFLHNGQRLRKVSPTMALDEQGTTHVISGNPVVQVFRFGPKRGRGKFIRGSGAKAVWRHDAWTLAALHDRFAADPDKGPMLRALQYLRADMSVGQVVISLGVAKKDVQTWVRQYNKEGLPVLLGTDAVIPPHFAKAIDRYLAEQPRRLRAVLSARGDRLVAMADEIGVEDYALDRWVVRRLAEGGNTEEYKA